MKRRGYMDRPQEPLQLNDTWFDPAKTGNLTGDPAHAGALDKVQRRLPQWIEQPVDPLPRGPVPLPTEAISNVRSCSSQNHNVFEPDGMH